MLKAYRKGLLRSWSPMAYDFMCLWLQRNKIKGPPRD
jgi:hypothetical protein